MRLRKGKEIALVHSIACSMSVLLILAGETMAERLPIKTYTTADGLPHDYINRIVQDSKGFLWFCTSEGLSRFDGYRFTNYGTEQGLPGRQVTDFLEARNGFYWVATNKGLCRFIPDPLPPETAAARRGASEKFLVYYPGESPRARYINAIYEDHAGTIWCCTEQGLYRVNQVSGDAVVSFVDIIEPGPPDAEVPLRTGAITEDRSGSLWIIAWAGLYRLRPDGTVERYKTEGWPEPILFEDRDGTTWVGSREGLDELVPNPTPNHPIIARRYTAKEGLAGDHVTSLCQSADGTLWIGSRAGLTRFVHGRKGEADRLQTYKEAYGLSGITALCEDRDHNLWMGIAYHGAMRLAASGFVTYNQADGLGGAHTGADRVSSIFENQAGELCVFGGASPNIAISKFAGGRFSAVPLNLPHGASYWGWGWYQVMFQDHNGEWWMSTGQGLVRYPRLKSLDQITHARPKAVYGTRDGLCTNEIFRLYEDSRGDVWISALGNRDCVLTRWERSTGTFHRYSPADGIPDHAPTAFCEDSAGNLWIGFYDGGLLRYAAGRFKQFTVADGVPPGFTQGLYLDHAGRLWIATGEGGVGRVDRPGDEHLSFAAYTTADGLSSNQANSITEDRWGMIYVGTGRGVDKLDPDTGRIRHYTAADGLASSIVGVSFRDRQGSLWFGCVQGLSRLDPRPERPAWPPPVFISAINIAGVPYPITELGAVSIVGPALDANQNNLQIEFVGLSFAAGESLHYQYKLEGAALDWSAPTDQRVVTYPNLPPGSYRFLVRAVRSDGTFSESPAAASFKILPPVWQRWWFRIGAVILIALPISALLRYRHQKTMAVREAEAALQRSREERLAELERVRRRIATDLHDDIGSSLTQISILSEVMRQNAGSDGSPATERLRSIARSSRELVDTMSDIVWAINPQKDQLSDLTQRMRRFASDVFTARNIAFTLRLPPVERDIKLGANLRREVFLIFKESINNMVRHSGCSRAEVEFQLAEDSLQLWLRDDGKGFDTAIQSDGHGLMSMRERASDIRGKLEVSSTIGKGTIVTLTAPLDGASGADS